MHKPLACEICFISFFVSNGQLRQTRFILGVFSLTHAIIFRIRLKRIYPKGSQKFRGENLKETNGLAIPAGRFFVKVFGFFGYFIQKIICYESLR